MARPREFDEEEVLDHAMRVFWERGFDGTSVADLEAATGLVRTSLYGAFGDKEKLFLRVLERFGQRYTDFFDKLMTGEPARVGFEAAFDAWFDMNCQKDGPRGCLVQLASTTGAADLPRAKALVHETTLSMDKTFVKALQRAHDRGELREGADVKTLARYLSVTMQGLSSAARSGKGRKELQPVVDLMLDTIFGGK
jgi:AcrR family transcriptional regulator